MSQPNQISITPPKVYDALNAPFSESVSNELAKTDLNELNYLCHEISLVACSVRVKFDKNTIQALKVIYSTLFDLISSESALIYVVDPIEDDKFSFKMSFPLLAVRGVFTERDVEFALTKVQSRAKFHLLSLQNPFTMFFSLSLPWSSFQIPHSTTLSHIHRFMRSLARTIHCSLPICVFVGEHFNIAPASPGFEITRWISSRLTASDVFSASDTSSRNKITVKMAVNVESFPHNSFSIIRFCNFRFCPLPTSVDFNITRQLFSTQPFKQSGFHLPETDELNSVTNFPFFELEPPLLSTLQVTVLPNVLTEGHSRRLYNTVILINSHEPRILDEDTQMDLYWRLITQCAAHASNMGSGFFDHAERSPSLKSKLAPEAFSNEPSHDDEQRFQPISAATALAEDAGEQGRMIKKQSRPKKANPKKKASSAVVSQSVGSYAPNADIAPAALNFGPKNDPSSASSRNKENGVEVSSIESSSNESTLRGTETLEGSTRREGAVIESVQGQEPNSASVPSQSSSQTAQTAQTAKRKRKRGGTGVEDDGKEMKMYLDTIVESITSIVQHSQNMDFVASCFSTLGLAPLSAAPNSTSGEESAQAQLERISQFRALLEKDLHESVDYLRQQNNGRGTRKASTTRGQDDEANHPFSSQLANQSEEDEEGEDWIEDLSAAELEALWEPQPVMPIDTEWSEMLWSPCAIQDLDETKFDQIYM